MEPPKIPSHVSFSNGQTAPNYYKSITNFMNIQCALHADKPFIRYYVDKHFETLTYAQIDCIATNMACRWMKFTENADNISFIGDHNVNYFIIMLAVLKLRIPLMPISPRISEAASLNLLKKTQTKLLLVTTKYKSMADNLASQITDLKIIVVESLDITSLLKEPIEPDHIELLDYKFSDDDLKKTALMFHSSGSVSLPKHNCLSNRYLFHMINPLQFGFSKERGLKELDESDTILSCAPLFHVFGFFATFATAIIGGKAVFMEKLPASADEVHFALEYNKCTVMLAPPIIYEQMIFYLKENNDFSTVKRLKLAAYGGAPLRHESGKWLHEHGINACDMYGTTEIGGSMIADLNPSNKNWSSLAPFLKDPSGNYYHVFETVDEAEPDIKHLYIRGDSPNLATDVSNRIDGGYDTNDLFRENSDFPGYYNYIGRRDDILIMENGENTNPVPIEASIRKSPVIKQVSVLGHGRHCTSALIEIDIDFVKRLSPEEIISSVHAAIKDTNKEFRGHNVILPQMIQILPFDKTLPTTDKGTVMRKKAEIEYIDMVEKLYKDLLEGPSRDATKHDTDTSSWTYEQLELFIIQCAVKVLDLPISTFVDRSQSLFDHGLDSISSIQFRNLILEYFDNIPPNFLFQHTSISSICKALAYTEEETNYDQTEARYQQTQQLAIDYINRADIDFSIASNLYDENQDKVILLTGITGSLGSFMLRDLLLDSSVKKVYVLIRGNPDELINRLFNAFESRFLDTSLLESDRVEVLPMRLNEHFLGLNDEKYFQLKNEITIVQHCAWLLDFNLPVDHYDKECISPFYNLLKFAYREVNPMHVHFVSSVSASARYGHVIPEEPLPLDSHICMPMGYAHSKFIVEILFNYLTTEKNFPCYIERLGQVCGDSVNGVWNISEQYPLMFIGGGSIMQKMPDLDTIIDWITVDYAAASIVDIMLKTAYLPAKEDQTIYHIVNPNIISWKDVLQSLKDSGMRFDIVPPSEWVKELAKDDTNPAFKLMSFYEENFNQSFKMPVWESKKTVEITSTMSKAPIFDSKLFDKFLACWKSVGFYDPTI